MPGHRYKSISTLTSTTEMAKFLHTRLLEIVVVVVVIHGLQEIGKTIEALTISGICTG